MLLTLLGISSIFPRLIPFSKESATLGQGIPIEVSFVSVTSGCYKRYSVSGKTLFQAELMEATGELVDISRGGACIRSEVKPLEGEEIAVRFTLQNYPEVFEVRGIVLRVQSDSWAMLFLGETVKLEKLLRSLDARAKKQVASPIGT